MNTNSIGRTLQRVGGMLSSNGRRTSTTRGGADRSRRGAPTGRQGGGLAGLVRRVIR